ncbi:hypothetical protein Tco_0468605 [Tanacetum coccineum]
MMNKNFLDMMRQIQSVKSVSPKCETCGDPHSFTECPAVDGYTQEAAYATTGNHNSGGNSYQPQGDRNMLSYRSNNYLGPPGFPPPNVQNNQNYNRTNQNQRNYQALNNQGRGQNFNQGNNNYQALNFQAPYYEAQVGPSNELTNYMKSIEATLRDMLTQMTNMKTELRNEFKSSLDTRTNKIENQNNQIMNITTRSGVAYDGPTIPPTLSPLSKEVEHETKATKDKVQTTSSECTAHVQPPVIQVPIPEPEVALKPNPKPSIPYPSRLNDQKLREKANYQIFRSGTYSDTADTRIDYDVDPQVPLILGRPFLRTAKALIDVYGEDSSSQCHRPLLCEEYSPRKARICGSFDECIPFPSDPIIASSSPSFTPFEGGDFILEEIETFLRTPNELSNLDDDYYDTREIFFTLRNC